MKKTVLAQIDVKQNSVEEFLTLAKEMVIKSNAESGCLIYALYNAIEKENEFFVYEKYENEKAVEYHNSSEHFNSFIKSVMPLLNREPVIEVF
ncbi:putative quinol monooxygenase [Aquimarina algicola]|uniref:Antibiotic biosynthesis monooxygenase n=1 Tax=Aquimarina algicola TaxID=2589995 RepID=A0A504J9C3_9FLAO|nr:putative quinol monooxygenase [Aquimarina algicola]TPN85185.1 antibiotic biosynthesis monooxygenase [Aquimarina algicola]